MEKIFSDYNFTPYTISIQFFLSKSLLGSVCQDEKYTGCHSKF